MVTIMTTNITLHTKGTAAHNQFETFWTTGRKQGVIDITISIDVLPALSLPAAR